jgi:hypothetical protein
MLLSGDVSDSTPPAVAKRYRSPQARPTVTDIYSSDSGWTRLPGAPRVTHSLAAELRAQGVTMVRTRWRFTTKEFTIASLIQPEESGR